MKAWFSVVCPYCEFKERLELDAFIHKSKHIVTCNLDAGGCDGDFVVETELEARSSVMVICASDKMIAKSEVPSND